MKTEVLKEGKESLKFDLTEKEILGLADRASVLDGQLKTKEHKKKEAQEFWKDEIASVRSALNNAFRLITDKFEFREVDVTLKFDYLNKKVHTLYNNEVRTTRDMTEYEFSTRPKDILPDNTTLVVAGDQPSSDSANRADEIAAKEANMAVKSADEIYQQTEAKTEQSTIINAANI